MRIPIKLNKSYWPEKLTSLLSCPVILYLQNLHFEMTGFSVIVNPLIVDRYMFINSLIQISGLFRTHYLGPFKINVFMERN